MSIVGLSLAGAACRLGCVNDTLDDRPAYQRKRNAVRVLAIVVIVALVLPGAAIVFHQQVFAPKPAARVEVVVANDTDATYIVWGNADPSPIPSGDYPVERYGFEVAPHTLASLPQDRSWDPVEVWTSDCVTVAEDSTPLAPGYIVAIGADGVVRVVPNRAGVMGLPAPPTKACALVPWTPTP
jgi:hypothetical protein